MVCVLMSTYNGEKYLEEQLNSLVQQEGVEIDIFVRDDGSTDGTCDILDRWQERGLLRWYTGENLGAAKSFFDLVVNAPKADYYAFCDQDDVWLPNKISRAVDRLSVLDKDKPNLYGSGYFTVDAQLNIIKEVLKSGLKLTKGNAMFESHIPGCTMVFNRTLIEIVKDNVPDISIFHDRWFFLTSIYLGDVVYENIASIKYRQHINNVLGVNSNERSSDKLRVLLSQKEVKLTPLNGVADEILLRYGDRLTVKDKRVLGYCANYKSSIMASLNLLFNPAFKLTSGGFKRKMYWKFKIFLKKI